MRENWIECQLGDLLTLKNGYAFKSTKYISDGIPVLRIGDINNWLVNSDNAKCVEEDSEYENYVVRNGDILIAMSGATTGKFGIYKSDKKAYQNQRVGNLKPYSEKYIIKNYIYMLLYSLKRQIEEDAYGGAQPNISSKKIESLSVGLAPLPEQRAIVAKIEQLFSELDNGIANLKTAQEQLKIYRQAVLKKAFEGGLTSEWREKNKTKFNWIETTTGEIMPDINSGSTPKAKFLFKEGDIQFLKVYNLNFDGTLNFQKDPAFTTSTIHNTSNKRAITKAGDVLINIVGPPLGKTSMIPLNSKREFNINQAIVRFRPNERILPKFLSLFLQNPETINWLEGTSKATAGQYNVKVTTCRVIPITLPLVEEQNEIVQQIESRLSVCDKVEETIAVNLQKAEALRQSILKKAFAGELLTEAEIAACKKEKDWEPAGELLKRIKKEKLK